MQIVLASKSKARIFLLQSAGVEHIALAAQIDEGRYLGSTPADTAAVRALAKAEDVAARVGPDSLIIGSDQTLSCDGVMFTKVQKREEACEKLAFLAGKTHFLHSAVVLLRKSRNESSEQVWQSVLNAKLKMRSLTRSQIQLYVTKYDEWKDAVGCYHYEGVGIQLFESVEVEDPAVIMGMPMLGLLGALRRYGRDFL